MYSGATGADRFVMKETSFVLGEGGNGSNELRAELVSDDLVYVGLCKSANAVFSGCLVVVSVKRSSAFGWAQYYRRRLARSPSNILWNKVPPRLSGF